MSVATTTTTATPSEELLLSQKKDARIQMLERQKQRQAEELTLLRSEIGASQIKHKEDIYWMRLECDSLRRDKEAAEDRMAELLRDLKDLANDRAAEQQQDDDLPEVLDAPYVLHLQSQLDKSMQTVGILDNQISMVKKSCDEVVKSLKEEIGDVMDDKCRMEMELMNQLASLDNEKRQVELQYEEEIKEKQNVIAELKQLGLSLQQQQTTTSTSTTDNPNGNGTGNMNSELLLQEQVQELQQVNTKLSEQLQNVRNESRDEVIRLEDVNSDLRQELSSLQKEFESTKREASSSDAVQALDTLTRDRQETMETLERVAIIWEKADDSIQQLEHTMDALKPNDDQEETTSPDGERLLSTLETASLVHGQVKVALLLIELKLRNQLGSLKNDKKYRPSTSTHKKGDTKLMEKISEIQQEAVQAMSQVEHSLSNQIQQLQQISSVEDEDLIQTKTMQVASYKQQVQTLQDELSRLQQQQSSSTKHNPKTLGVSRAVMERLQNEVLTVAQRVKDKNETIEKLTHQVKEHKVREAALKKEMKRLLKRRAER